MDRRSAISERAERQGRAVAAGEGQGPLRVLIVLGHPRVDSLCGALARAYREGAVESGAEVRDLRLADLEFTPDVTVANILAQPVEQDLAQAQELIAWADHLVFVYPTWWGTMPARLKAFLDRTLTPGFAFAKRPVGQGFLPLLRGRTAELVTTMDTPKWVYRWLFKAPGHHAMRHAILGFCGIEVTRVSGFGPVDGSSPDRRRSWLHAVHRCGRALADGAITTRHRAQRKLAASLQAFRLQFYPMTWLAYALGAAAAPATSGLDPLLFWCGLIFLFLLEVATVFTNECVDFESDLRNQYFGPFTGGSRVLVDGRLTFGDLRAGAAVALGLAALTAMLILATLPAQHLAIAAIFLVMTVLALGYTLPPLQLSYRGLGELDVGFTHSIGVMLCGFVLQGGAWHDDAPWLLGTPLGLAILPGIILAGIPDHDADQAVGKTTLAVRFGVRGAYRLAFATTLLAAAAALALEHTDALAGAFHGIGYVVVPHAALLAVVLRRRARTAAGAERIDGLMAGALSYTVWFGAVPLINLL